MHVHLYHKIEEGEDLSFFARKLKDSGIKSGFTSSRGQRFFTIPSINNKETSDAIVNLDASGWYIYLAIQPRHKDGLGCVHHIDRAAVCSMRCEIASFCRV